MSKRFAILEKVKQLDPKEDCQEIVYLVGSYEYPWLMKKSLEFALFRTYAVSSVSKLLAETQQFEKHGQRRYDDTSLIIAEITENGYDSERGQQAIKQMNRMHHRFNIANEDYLYVLSTFIYEPTRWHQQYGWRQPTETENLANYYFWVEVGKRMGLKNIPDTYEKFEAFNIAYEQEHFRFTESNQQIANYTIEVFASWYPFFLAPSVRKAIYAFMDDPLREAFGFPKQPALLRGLVKGGLKFLGKIVRLLPPRTKPYSYTQQKSRSYPFGYQIEKLGPPGEL